MLKRSKVYFIGAGAGDPGLITVKGRKLLDEADVVIYAMAGPVFEILKNQTTDHRPQTKCLKLK